MITMMIKFIGRVFGIRRYKVFLALGEFCWREVKGHSFVSFKNACIFADHMKKEMGNVFGDNVTHVVAFSRNTKDKPLYSA